MSFVLQPWQLLFAILAGWVTGRQQAVIDYLWVENQVLEEKLGKKRILLSDDQRRRLAVKGKVLGRKALEQIATLVTPDTILRWHRQLIAEKWDYSDRRQRPPGRPPTAPEVVAQVVRLAGENPTWGYDRIQGALANLGHEISDTTVANILKVHGIEPAPGRRRRTCWRTFIKTHWDVLASIDFTTVEVWTMGGLITYYLLFVMKVRTRQVYFAGCTVSPDTMDTTVSGYSHTQKAPLCLIVYGTALALLVGAWLAQDQQTAFLVLGVGGIATAVVATAFHHLIVTDAGNALTVRFGPLPMFRLTIPYDDMAAGRAARMF